MAEQRNFLLQLAESPYVLFLDDDLILENFVIDNLVRAIQKYHCGFVGQAALALSYQLDYRPEEEQIEFWPDDRIETEKIVPNDKKWQRYVLHNAANLYHVQQKLGILPPQSRPYKVAWIGSCVLYDRKKLLDSGGFSFWQELPPEHVGEDVQAELQVMERYGGCGLIPSGVYHQESPTTLPRREVNAPEFFQTAQTTD